MYRYHVGYMNTVIRLAKRQTKKYFKRFKKIFVKYFSLKVTFLTPLYKSIYFRMVSDSYN